MRTLHDGVVGVCGGYQMLCSWGVGSCWQDGLAFVRYLVRFLPSGKDETRRDETE